jgi:hypothetical protein
MSPVLSFTPMAARESVSDVGRTSAWTVSPRSISCSQTFEPVRPVAR